MSIGDTVTDTSHTDGIGLGCLKVLQPVAEVFKQQVVILEPRSEAETMITCGIDMHRTFVAGITHRLIVLQSVGDERHQTVIAGGDDDSRRCEMTAHSIHR